MLLLGHGTAGEFPAALLGWPPTAAGDLPAVRSARGGAWGRRRGRLPALRPDGGLGVAGSGAPVGGGEDSGTSREEEEVHHQRRHRGVAGVEGCVFCLLIFSLLTLARSGHFS